MSVGMIAWLVALGVLIWLAVRGASQPKTGGHGDAEEELRRRFANGEVDADEFARRLEVLRKSR